MTGHTHLTLAGRRHGAFAICGWTGFWLAVVLTSALCAATGRSLPDQWVIAAGAAAVYYSVVAITRRILGRQALIYYHHVLIFLAVAAGLAALLGAPVLAQLDITACGLALFTAVARVGCLLVGCCHGQPARRGVVYGPVHRRYGVEPFLFGLPLLPVPAFEAAGCAAIALGGSAAVLAGAPAGSALSAFLAGYAALRFALEWLRGDVARPYHFRLSEAQWISLALAFAVAALAATGTLPGRFPALVVGIAVLAAAILTAAGAAPCSHALLGPTHIRELAERLRRLPTSTPEHVRTVVSSLGVCVSLGATAGHAHYTVSCATPLGKGYEARLAALVQWICGSDGAVELRPGNAGTLHVLVPLTGR